MHGFPGAARLDEGHQLALVVRRAAAADDPALGCILDLRIERFAIPKIKRINRLHVIVPVEHQVRPGSARVAHHHGMAGGRADVGLDPQRPQIEHQPFGGALAVVAECRVGRDRRDPQQVQQAFGCGGQVGVDAGEDGVKAHGAEIPRFAFAAHGSRGWARVQRVTGETARCALG